MKHFILRLFVFLCMLAIFAELFFHTVVPAREAPVTQYNHTYGVENYNPAVQPDGLYTFGRQAQQRIPWHINAQGWNQTEDFLPDHERTKPMVAMLGDSYVEGFHIAPKDHIMQVFRRLSNERFATYQLGMSGSQFGEFIQLSKYMASERYTPKVLVILINDGDFHGSISSDVKRPSGPLKIEIGHSGSAKLTAPRAKPVVRWRRWLRESATMRYLVWNANVNPFGGKADRGASLRAQALDQDLNSDPQFAIAFRFLHRSIKAQLPDTEVVYLIDANRRDFSAQKPPKPLPASALIKRLCSELACTHIDLTTTFYTHWTTTKQALDFGHDYHWNAVAHRLAATHLYSTLKLRFPML